jgi:hypothetical protein
MSTIIAVMPMCPECGYYLTKYKSETPNYCAKCGYTAPVNLPQDRSEADQRELARLKRFQAGTTDAPAPEYERSG